MKARERFTRYTARVPAPALVCLGGGLGSLARMYTPASAVVANLLGAFILGALTSGWSARSRRHGTASVRAHRLLFGTGMLGGYTTYGALIAGFNPLDNTPVHRLLSIGTHSPLDASAPALEIFVLLIGGLGAAGLGLWLGECWAHGGKIAQKERHK